MTVFLRLVIAFSSLVIAWLCVSMVAGIIFGRGSAGNGLLVIAAIIFGGFVYADIVRRERQGS